MRHNKIMCTPVIKLMSFFFELVNLIPKGKRSHYEKTRNQLYHRLSTVELVAFNEFSTRHGNKGNL